MSTAALLKHPITPTNTSKRVLRARLSLKETQTEFAARFLVTRVTVHKWETGKSSKLLLIHERILEALIDRLRAEGRLLPDEAFLTLYREFVEKRGVNAY